MQEVIERIASALADLSADLGRPELDPDPARTDWAAHDALVTRVDERCEAELLAPFEEIREGLDAELRDSVAGQVTGAAGSVVALLHAAGRADRASALLDRALALAPPDAEELASAQRDMAGYVALERGRWLARYRSDEVARPLFERVIAGSQEQALARAAREAREAARAPPGRHPTGLRRARVVMGLGLVALLALAALVAWFALGR